MSDYKVQIQHATGLGFEVSNERTQLRTEWNPTDGAWLATELLLASLGACMLATMMDYAQNNGLDITGSSVEVTADTETRPVRMGRIHITYLLPDGLTEAQVGALVRAGDRCKVHNTIAHHPEFVVACKTIAAHDA